MLLYGGQIHGVSVGALGDILLDLGMEGQIPSWCK